MNWAGAGFAAGGTLMQVGSDLTAIGGMMIEGAAKQAQIAGNIMASVSKQLGYEMQAKAYGVAAKDAVKAAGRVQEQGRLSRESRLVQLGQQKGRITTSAAGSGLDVSSRTVRKTFNDTIKSAYNDSAVIAENEKQAAQQKINDSITAQENKIWSEYNANVEQINQTLMFKQSDLQAQATRNNIIGGALSAGAHLFQGMAGAAAVGSLG